MSCDDKIYCPNCNATLNSQDGFDPDLDVWVCTECGQRLSDQYYCPNCNAIFNSQDGFDPNLDFWVCTECGQISMPDDIYNGDTFQGVAWYCNQCYGLLNRQHGFSDRYETWKCTECGFVNPITEDNIINNDKVTDSHKAHTNPFVALFYNKIVLLLNTAVYAALCFISVMLFDYLGESFFEVCANVFLIFAMIFGGISLVNIIVTVIIPFVKKKCIATPQVNKVNNGKLKFCKYCGAEIHTDSIFCSYCGKNISDNNDA